MTQIKYTHTDEGDKHYTVTEEYVYHSPRYNRDLTIPVGFKSDGATGIFDVNSDAWIIHDWICDVGKWDDGMLIDNWTASTVFADVLWKDGHKWLSVAGWIGTFLGGGGKARENGLFRVKRKR